MTAATFGATSAFATDYKTTITLALGNNGALANESYTLTVPETLNISQKGWNAMDGIHVVKDDTDFNTGKQLVVTASSTNSFALKSDENSISYTLTTEENGTQTTEWTFSAAEINADGGTTKPIGITVTWDETQAAGTYTDEITYTVEVKDAASLLSLTVTDPDELGIGSRTIYYASGETWAEALANHTTENPTGNDDPDSGQDGFAVENGIVVYVQIAGARWNVWVDSNQVVGTDAISSTLSYYFNID